MRQPHIGDAVRIRAGSRAGAGAFDQAIGVVGGGGAYPAAIVARGGNGGHHLSAPGLILRPGVGVYTASNGPTEQGIIAIIGDVLIVGVVGCAMRVVERRQIADAGSHSGVEVHVAGQVRPIGGIVVVLRGISPDNVMGEINVIIGERAAIAQAQAFEDVADSILVDGGGDAGESVQARAVALYLGVDVPTLEKGGVVVGEHVGGVRVAGAA